MTKQRLHISLLLASVAVSMMIFTSCKSSHKVVEKPRYSDEIYEKPSSGVETNNNLRKEIKEWMGVPYVYGGHSKDGTDCSGLVMEIYLKVYGIKLHRNSRAMYEKNCTHIDKSSLREGDLVFFSRGKTAESINHVGIYLDNNKFVHASSKGVMVNDLDEAYYTNHYIGAGRVER